MNHNQAGPGTDEHLLFGILTFSVAAEIIVYLRVTGQKQILWIVPTTLAVIAYTFFTVLIYRRYLAMVEGRTKYVALAFKFITSKTFFGIFTMLSLAEVFPEKKDFFQQTA